jgi:hypothetical protein
MTSSFMRMLVGLGVALLSACGGGGGGGGEPSATVSFDTATLSATAFQNQKANTNASQDATSTVTATVSGTLSGVVYVVVRDTATGFAGSPIQVVQTAGGGYRATLKPNVALVAGSYTGNLEVHLCKDVGCAQEYPVQGGTLPYKLTILPQLQATVLVNGSQVGTALSGRITLPVSLTSGSVLEIRTNAPVRILHSSGPGMIVVTVDPASTSTAWKAVLTRSAFPTSSTLSFSADAQDAAREAELAASIDVTMR